MCVFCFEKRIQCYEDIAYNVQLLDLQCVQIQCIQMRTAQMNASMSSPVLFLLPCIFSYCSLLISSYVSLMLWIATYGSWVESHMECLFLCVFICISLLATIFCCFCFEHEQLIGTLPVFPKFSCIGCLSLHSNTLFSLVPIFSCFSLSSFYFHSNVQMFSSLLH